MRVHAHYGDDCSFMINLFVFFLVEAWFSKAGNKVQLLDSFFPLEKSSSILPRARQRQRSQFLLLREHLQMRNVLQMSLLSMNSWPILFHTCWTQNHMTQKHHSKCDLNSGNRIYVNSVGFLP